METGFKFLSALITATTLISPIAFAADDTAPAAEEIHNRVAYGTPTIDGKLDDLVSEVRKDRLQAEAVVPHG